MEAAGSTRAVPPRPGAQLEPQEPSEGSAARGEQQRPAAPGPGHGGAPVTDTENAHPSQSRALGTSVTAEGVTHVETKMLFKG